MNFINLSSILLILFVAPINSVAKVCLIDDIQIINLSFNYENSNFHFLPGVNQDRKTMSELFGRFGKKTNLTDQDIYDKEDILKVFKQKIASAKSKGITKPDIYFNYAGHGLLTESGIFAIPLPKAPKTCFKEMEVSLQGNKNESLYRGLYTTSYLNEVSSRNSARVKINNCPSERGLKPPENCKSDNYTKTMTVFNDSDPNCTRFILSAADIENVSKEANIYGFIDSCHSGALTKSKGINTIASAQADELASDDPGKGGKLFQFAKDLINDYSCSFSDEELERLTLRHILEKLPKVHMTAEVLPDTQTFRGLGREALQNLYFKNQSPAVSKELAEDPSELGCLFVNRSRDPQCKNPLEYIHQASSKISCGDNKFVEPNESLVILYESKFPTEYKGYTKTCGRFTISSADLYKVRKLDYSENEKPVQNSGKVQTGNK